MNKKDIRDGICAYLQGGLGNQLFIYAAAFSLAQKLSCNLYIDISRYSKRDPLDRHKETPRAPEITSLGLVGTVIDTESPWYGNSPRRPSMIRAPKSNSMGLKVYKESKLGFNPSFNEIKEGTTLYGYFQSYKYFQDFEAEIEKMLNESAINEKDQVTINYLEHLHTIHAHVRRGDYINPEISAHHGLASENYFKRSQNLITQLIGSSPMSVFTDSPEIVKKEFSSIRDYSIVDDSGLSSFGAIRALSQGNSLIMSNSSFSWWAAWLMTRESDKPIIAPRPWQQNGSAAADLLLPSWITLDSR